MMIDDDYDNDNDGPKSEAHQRGRGLFDANPYSVDKAEAGNVFRASSRRRTFFSDPMNRTKYEGDLGIGDETGGADGGIDGVAGGASEAEMVAVRREEMQERKKRHENAQNPSSTSHRRGTYFGSFPEGHVRVGVVVSPDNEKRTVWMGSNRRQTYFDDPMNPTQPYQKAHHVKNKKASIQNKTRASPSGKQSYEMQQQRTPSGSLPHFMQSTHVSQQKTFAQRHSLKELPATPKRDTSPRSSNANVGIPKGLQIKAGASKGKSPSSYAELMLQRQGYSSEKKHEEEENTNVPQHSKKNALVYILKHKNIVGELWKRIDYNGNGIVSLAEIDKMVTDLESSGKYQDFFRGLNHKPALIRAYKATISVSGGGDGDDWVERKEFRQLLRNLYFYNKLWSTFAQIDTGGDHRISFSEFAVGIQLMGIDISSAEEARAIFSNMDSGAEDGSGKGGGKILFDEFCHFCAHAMVCGLGAASKHLQNKPKAESKVASVYEGAAHNNDVRNSGIEQVKLSSRDQHKHSVAHKDMTTRREPKEEHQVRQEPKGVEKAEEHANTSPQIADARVLMLSQRLSDDYEIPKQIAHKLSKHLYEKLSEDQFEEINHSMVALRKQLKALNMNEHLEKWKATGSVAPFSSPGIASQNKVRGNQFEVLHEPEPSDQHELPAFYSFPKHAASPTTPTTPILEKTPNFLGAYNWQMAPGPTLRREHTYGNLRPKDKHIAAMIDNVTALLEATITEQESAYKNGITDFSPSKIKSWRKQQAHQEFKSCDCFTIDMLCSHLLKVSGGKMALRSYIHTILPLEYSIHSIVDELYRTGNKDTAITWDTFEMFLDSIIKNGDIENKRITALARDKSKHCGDYVDPDLERILNGPAELLESSEDEEKGDTKAVAPLENNANHSDSVGQQKPTHNSTNHEFFLHGSKTTKDDNDERPHTIHLARMRVSTATFDKAKETAAVRRKEISDAKKKAVSSGQNVEKPHTIHLARMRVSTTTFEKALETQAILNSPIPKDTKGGDDMQYSNTFDKGVGVSPMIKKYVSENNSASTSVTDAGEKEFASSRVESFSQTDISGEIAPFRALNDKRTEDEKKVINKDQSKKRPDSLAEISILQHGGFLYKWGKNRKRKLKYVQLSSDQRTLSWMDPISLSKSKSCAIADIGAIALGPANPFLTKLKAKNPQFKHTVFSISLSSRNRASLDLEVVIPPAGDHSLLLEQAAKIRDKWVLALRDLISAGGNIKGRHGSFRIGHAKHATPFSMDTTGAENSENFGSLCLGKDSKLMLDAAGGPEKTKLGQMIQMWATVEHPEWIQQFRFGADGTLGPSSHWCDHKLLRRLCLGVERKKNGETVVQLVERGDPRALVFCSSSDKETQNYLNQLVEERKAAEAAFLAMKADAVARCSEEMKAELVKYGWTQLRGAIPQDLVRSARKEINRELGAATGSNDQFKAKTFASHPAILSLVKDSMLPYVLTQLLGGTPEFYISQINAGQLALRFPGDMCDGATTECSQAQYTRVRKGWHIDGCPSEFIPGVTSHYGKINNFSILIGCLLSDVQAPLSGQLCVYPGSHQALADCFSANDGKKLADVANKGVSELPWDLTDELFPRGAVQSQGRAGDVFLANYMTAHFIAPNTAPDIRYAVYFRVSGPKFLSAKARSENGTRMESMLDPWCDWQLGGGGKAKEGSNSASVAPAVLEYRSQEELQKERNLQHHLSTTNYDYTATLSLRSLVAAKKAAKKLAK